jgi:hypothetical protein
MQSTVAATLLQYKAEYYVKINLRQPVIIAWCLHIAGNRNLWLITMEASVNPNKPAVILIFLEKVGTI